MVPSLWRWCGVDAMLVFGLCGGGGGVCVGVVLVYAFC